MIGDADTCVAHGWTLPDFAAACFDGGARLLQIRAKHMAASDFLVVSSAIVEKAAAYGAQVIINDRADIAALAAAHGVHVGQDDLSPIAVREVAGSMMVVGVSTHTAEQLTEALQAPVDYVAVGPVFATDTKKTGYTAVGLSSVRTAVQLASPANQPVVAIGGITLERAADVLDAGAVAVAVISDLLATENPTARVREYLHRLAR